MNKALKNPKIKNNLKFFQRNKQKYNQILINKIKLFII